MPVLAFFLANLNLTWIWAVALEQLLCSTKNQSKCLRNNVLPKPILFLFYFYFFSFQNSFSQVEPESSAITAFLSELQVSGYFYFSQLEAGQKRKGWQREREWVREGGSVWLHVWAWECAVTCLSILVRTNTWRITFIGSTFCLVHTDFIIKS